MAHEPSDAGRRIRLLAKRHREIVSLEEKITAAEARERRMTGQAETDAAETQQNLGETFTALNHRDHIGPGPYYPPTANAEVRAAVGVDR